MRRQAIILLMFLLMLFSPVASFADQTLISRYVSEEPALDGIANDKVWKEARAVISRDPIAEISVTIKSVHTDTKIFFLVSFPDADESRSHKSWMWIKERGIYNVGHDIEDIFVFKWGLANNLIDMSIYANSPSKADVWFWKSCRTNPLGYADDKMHILSSVKMNDAIKVSSKEGNTMYLLRKEDSGRSAYRTKMPVEYVGDSLPRYINQTPSGSRADIKAKGHWQNGAWTIELGRKLITGNDDDVQFHTTKRYQFGISRYEVAGRKKNPNLSQPLYGTGDTGENLTLVFKGK